jgi:4-amino-4-deoxy-L-arabinose transferase-like glycosyltransferase
VGVIRILSASETGDGRTTWLKSAEDDFETRQRTDPLPRDDGGGVATATSSHSPLYYGTLVPAYALAKGDSDFTTLTWARIGSALYGAIVAAMAFLLVMELFPRRRPLAVAAGLMVGFHPMFAFMSGSVNNDMGVNASAAVLLYLTIRAMTRGLTPRMGVAIGAVLVIAPLMKGTAYALYPAVALGLAYALWRQRSRTAVVSAAAVLGVGLLLFLGWTEVSSYFDRSTFTTPGGEAPGSNFPARENPRGTLAYLWQIFFPPVGMVDYWNYPGGWPFFDVYVVRGFGSFGWYAMTFADWVYWVIVVAMAAVAAMAGIALWRHRDRLREIAPRAIVLLVAVVALIAGVHAFYFPDAPRSPPFPEQGRYAFPLIVAFAAFVSSAAFAFGRRHVVPVATALTVLVMGLAYAAQFLALTRFFS